MDSLSTQIDQLVPASGENSGSIGRMLRYFAGLPRTTASEEYRLLMEMKVLSFLREVFAAHPGKAAVIVGRFPELPGLRVSRGVFSPECATDSYLWAKYVAARGLVLGKSVLEMGAGCGIISFMLRAISCPSFLCAVDVNPYAVEDLRVNANHFAVCGDHFCAIQSDLLDSVPKHFRFDVALWAMPWILRDDVVIERIVREAQDPIESALLRSAVDPGGRYIRRFITEAKHYLATGGKILLISAEFIPNDTLLGHARSEGFEVHQRVFATGVTTCENPKMTLDLFQLEFTKG